MQIVTDSSADLAPEQLENLKIHIIPLIVTLGNQQLVDVDYQTFYDMLERSDELPKTSQPAVGDIADCYRKLAETDPDIISIHVSSKLSGTFNAAKMAAQSVETANVTLIDSRVLAAGQGWLVEIAAQANQAGWSRDEIVDVVEQALDQMNGMFTTPTLKYLIAGGRISNLTGFFANTLNIKPIVGINPKAGVTTQKGRVRTFKKALRRIAELVTEHHPEGSKLRVQLLQAANPDGAEILREEMDKLFECSYVPTCQVSPVLVAHTGPGLTGLVYASLESYPVIESKISVD